MKKTEKTPSPLRVVLWLATLLTLMIAPPASADVYSGPDAFGYIGSRIAGNLRDISTAGTDVGLADDDVSDAIPIPFPFLFYGVPVYNVFISSNGFITFSPGQNNGCCSGYPLPRANSPNNVVAGFWADLNPLAGGRIRYATIGPDGSREFVVEFNNVPHYGNSLPATFQIILLEGGAIELQYGSAMSNGSNHTVGIENGDGAVGLQIAYGYVSFAQEGFLITSPIFDTFDVYKAKVSFGRGKELDKYEVEGQFALSKFSDGMIDLSAEDIFITVGTSDLAIPAGSFKSKRHGGEFKFSGSANGAFIHATIKSAGDNAFRYSIEARDVDLTGSPLPINFSLGVGVDVGYTTIPLYGDLSSGTKRDHGHDRRDKHHDDH